MRRAWLCGVDALTGRSFDHRRDWVEYRLLELAGIFAVSLYVHAVMSNHTHLVLRVDPAAAQAWSDGLTEHSLGLKVQHPGSTSQGLNMPLVWE